MKRAAALITFALIGASAHGQSADAKPSFEVASIKPAPPPDGHGMRVGMHGGPGTPDPERVTFENFTLSALIGTAYDVKWYQMPGADPNADRFEVTATMAPGTTKDQFRLMLQNLLAERFKLAVHKEMREIPIYALTVAKGGPKLKKAAADPDDNEPEKDDPHPGAARIKKDGDGFPILPKGVTMAITGNRARVAGPKQSIAWLVDQLSGQAQRPVVDQTGLTGEYELTLSWAPNPNAPDAESLPDLFTAVQQQLGLKLESKKGPVEALILDHAEKMPSGN
jgi:uncharacterized protein (TIGR03435 family)